MGRHLLLSHNLVQSVQWSKFQFPLYGKRGMRSLQCVGVVGALHTRFGVFGELPITTTTDCRPLLEACGSHSSTKIAISFSISDPVGFVFKYISLFVFTSFKSD